MLVTVVQNAGGIKVSCGRGGVWWQWPVSDCRHGELAGAGAAQQTRGRRGLRCSAADVAFTRSSRLVSVIPLSK